MTNQQRSHHLLFSRRVRELMDRPLPTVDDQAVCRDVLGLLRGSSQPAVLVVDSAQRIRGMVTTEDVVNRITFRVQPDTPIAQVMRSPVHLGYQDDYLFQAVNLMRQQELAYLPIVARFERPVGTLHLDAALSAALGSQLSLTEHLAPGDIPEQWLQSKQAQAALAETLLEVGVPAPEIQALLTQVNNDLYARIVDALQAQMANHGWGQPPVAFDLMIMGSGGRGESFLAPDQDNGFVLADYPDTRHTRVDAYFIELAQRLTDSLNGIGIPYCKGFVMATNPLWRKPYHQWRKQIQTWLARPNNATLRLADIFFDFQPVYGDGRLASALRDWLTQQIPACHRFLQEMQQVQQGHGVALGLFNRLTTDSNADHPKGKLNLKYHGLLPLVEAIRLLALRERVAQTNTLERIERLHERQVLEGDERDYLIGAFHLLTHLLLRQQVRDRTAKLPISNLVPPEALTSRERVQLVDGLRAIERLRKRVQSEFSGDL